MRAFRLLPEFNPFLTHKKIKKKEEEIFICCEKVLFIKKGFNNSLWLNSPGTDRKGFQHEKRKTASGVKVVLRAFVLVVLRSLPQNSLHEKYLPSVEQ